MIEETAAKLSVEAVNRKKFMDTVRRQSKKYPAKSVRY